MDPGMLIDTKPEAMADVPGVCELPLTRAVVQYRDLHEMDTPGGRIDDVGLAVVVEGRYASSSEALDLGSSRIKLLDLSTELVVLDWVYEPTLAHLRGLVAEETSGSRPGHLRSYAFRLALTVLERLGFGPLTRPTFLRIGFRDICRDFDLHEGTSIRFVMGAGRLARAHMDYDACALVFRTAFHHADAVLERALTSAFPEGTVKRMVPLVATDSLSYQVRFPLPLSLREARGNLDGVRRGLASLMARFEPERFHTVGHVLETFGARETLAGVNVHEPKVRPVSVPGISAGQMAVH